MNPLTHRENSVPAFGQVAILGVGLIGGSIGLALKRSHAATEIIGIGRDMGKLHTALALGAIDYATTDWTAGVAEADLIVLCTSIRHIIAAAPEILAAARADATITDVGSIKGAIVRSAGSDPRFIGGHPMAGSEKGGVEAARDSLFHGATWAVCPEQNTHTDAIAALEHLIDICGAVPLRLDADTHDRMAAITSHVPHALASALVRLADHARHDFPLIPLLSAGSFADMTRIAASSPEIWRDVCLANREAVLSALEGYQAQLEHFAEAVRRADPAALEAFFSEGSAAKARWTDARRETP